MDVFEVIAIAAGILCIIVFIVWSVRQIQHDYKVLEQRRNANKSIDISINGEIKKATYNNIKGFIILPSNPKQGDVINITIKND